MHSSHRRDRNFLVGAFSKTKNFCSVNYEPNKIVINFIIIIINYYNCYYHGYYYYYRYYCCYYYYY